MEAELRIRGDNFDFTVPLGDGPATVVAGSPSWEEHTRPGRVSVPGYQGTTLLGIDVPVLFDGWASQRNVEDQVEQVLSISRGVGDRRPPDFTATGPIPFSGGRYVMGALPDWGDGLRGPSGGLRRQALILHLMQFVDADTIRPRSRGARIGLSDNIPLTGHHAARVITLQSAMTLLQVAARELGSAALAAPLAEANGIRDIRRPLPAGTKITLPARLT